MLPHAIIFLTLAAVSAIAGFGATGPRAERIADAASVLFLALFVVCLLVGHCRQRHDGQAPTHDARFIPRSSARQRPSRMFERGARHGAGAAEGATTR